MYTIEWIRWLLNGPDAKKEFHLGIKAQGKDKLMGFIAGTTVKVQINKETMKMAEVNLMTVHAKLR
jgi:glycylpeptide N-tetradecanoyltransferase